MLFALQQYWTPKANSPVWKHRSVHRRQEGWQWFHSIDCHPGGCASCLLWKLCFHLLLLCVCFDFDFLFRSRERSYLGLKSMYTTLLVKGLLNYDYAQIMISDTKGYWPNGKLIWRFIRFSFSSANEGTIPPSNNAFCYHFQWETLRDRNDVVCTLQAHGDGARGVKHLFSKKIQLKYLHYGHHELVSCIVFPFFPPPLDSS